MWRGAAANVARGSLARSGRKSAGGAPLPAAISRAFQRPLARREQASVRNHDVHGSRLRLERLDRLEPLEGLRASRLPLRFSGEPDFLRFLRSAGLLLCDDGITI